MGDFLFWNDEWNTGIPDVDEMHRAMAVKLNQVFELSRQAGGAMESGLGDVLGEFLELTRDHFGEEEKKMRQCSYPGYSDHKKEHILLVGELVQYIRELEQGRVTLDASTQRDLKNWFVAHVVIADRAFADFFHSLD